MIPRLSFAISNQVSILSQYRAALAPGLLYQWFYIYEQEIFCVYERKCIVYNYKVIVLCRNLDNKLKASTGVNGKRRLAACMSNN